VPLQAIPVQAQGILIPSSDGQVHQPAYIPNEVVQEAPVPQMKLEDLLAATAAKEQAEQQAIFDAVLKQQVTGTIKMTPEGVAIVGGNIEVSAAVPQMNSAENAAPIQAPL
jgi:hypothetical protein